MAGRNYIPPESLKPRPDSSRSRRPLIESPPSRHQIIDDRTAVDREIQSLLADNQRLATTHVALKQELNVALQDLRYFSTAAGKIKAEKDAEVREVFEKAIKMENEVRLIDELSGELVVVKTDVQKLITERKELNERLDKVHGEFAKDRAKAVQFSVLKSEIEAMQKEIQRGRAAVEFEKKVYACNIEQSQAMEKSKTSMTLEIEKLKAELADKEKKALAVAAAAATNTPGTTYAAGFTNHNLGYGGNSYPVPYAVHQVQGGVNPQYGPVPVTNGVYGMQRVMVNHPHNVPGPVPHVPYNMQHPNAHG
ncbi:protein FLC EXPRESSOR-like [Rutidosis leptorrhynchoides]|uniref:protein FLC EXPRESSOR-like n=1 Tax=Rutidosis leptorrhynchoides TaxID=125765 RepID=UPI003A98F51F